MRDVRVGADQRDGPAVVCRGKLKRRDQVGDCGKTSSLEIPRGNRVRNDQRRGDVHRSQRRRRLPGCSIPAARGHQQRSAESQSDDGAPQTGRGHRRSIHPFAEIWARSGDNLAVYGGAGWHDFFLMVGGGAAALTGLVFVAMSLHLDQIALNAAHRHRARTVLTGLTAVFIRCGLILMAGQSAQMVAADVILVLLVVEFVLYRSIRQATAASNVPDPALVWRTIGSFACLVLEQIGAVALFAGDARGLYVVSVGMMASFIFMVSGAWLLIVGVRREEAAQTTA